MDLFHKLNTMDWFRVLWVVGGITFFWERLVSIVPPGLHKTVETILVALGLTITMMMRSGKSLVEKAEDNIKVAQAQVTEHIVERVTEQVTKEP